MNGWPVFSSSSTTNDWVTAANTTYATSANILYSGSTWVPKTSIALDATAKRPKDPLNWLTDEVNRYVELGRLDA